MAVTALRWQFEVERGPDWLFVRCGQPPEAEAVQGDFAEEVWGLLERHFTHRLVLELDLVETLSSRLIGQLVKLQKRLHQHDGILRICGLPRACEEALHTCRLDEGLHNFRNREEAVLGFRPSQPR